MPHAPDTGMFTAARRMSWYTVWAICKRGTGVYDAGVQKGSMHVDSACFPAALVVRPLPGSDVG